MRAAKIPVAQKRPRRTPLQELQLQPGADQTSLTPLLRRLRLKDHDCPATVSCSRGPRSSVTAVPCTPGPPRSATLVPPTSTTPGPRSRTTSEPARTSTLGLSNSELPRTPTLNPDASEASSNPTLMPGALVPPTSTSPEASDSPSPEPSTPKRPENTMPAPLCSVALWPSNMVPASTTVPAPLCSSIPVPSTTESPDSTVPAPQCSSILGPSTPEPPDSTVPAPQCSSILGPNTPEPPDSTAPVSLSSSIPVPSTLESPGSTTPGLPSIIIPVPCTPDSIALAPCTSGSPGSASTASCTPGLPGTTSTPQNVPFHGWRVAPPDFSCSSVASQSPSRDGSADLLPCQGTPEGPESPIPAPPEQSSPELPPIESSGLEPARSEAATTPVTSLEPALGAVSWMLPLMCLEKTLNASSLLESLRHSLPLHTPQRDASTSMTPMPMVVTGTSTTPVPTMVAGTSTTPVPTVVTGTSTTPVPTVIAGTSTTPVSTIVTGTSTTPVPTVVAGTSTTPVSTIVTGTSTTPVPTVVAGTSTTPVSTIVTGTSTTPVSTVVTGTSTTPASTVVTGTSTTPVSTVVTGTSTTPMSTVVTGTSTTPVSTIVTGTCMTPVPTVVTGTSTTPVPSTIAGTSMTPVPTAVVGTSMTPVANMAIGTSMTPVLTAVTGTFMTPRDLWERSINTSGGGLPCAKDSAAETDSLLWHCPREQLKTLPRAELEGRLESSLIIIEALSLQLRGWQESQQLLPGVGPAEQRDTLTQTDITHPKGEEEVYRHLYLELWRKTEALQRQRGAERDLQRELELAAEGTSTWSKQCLLFRSLADAAFQSLQDEQGALAEEWEQAKALVSQCRAVLESVPSKLRSCLEERDAMRQRADEALRAKEEGYCFLEAFRAHASAQISARDQSLVSQQELGTLLADAIDLQTSLSAEAQPFREFIDVTFENLEKERRALDVEREQVRALMSQCRAVLESVPSKLRSCLEERDAMRQRADEVLQAKEELSAQLEETSAALQNAEAQLEQLTVANSRLGTDLSSVMTNLASVEQERDALQQENEKQWEEMAELAQERNTLQRECNELCQELREVTECREFLNQENHMSRTQLLEVEARLNSTLAMLQEHILQHEELMDSHQRLREEQAALSKELESTKAELLSLQTKRKKVSWCSTDVTESKMRLQELADCLKAALEEQDDDDAPSISKAWTPAPRTPGWQTPRRAWTPAFRTPACCTPYRPGSSFVGSVLKAMSGKDASEATRGGSTVKKDKLASTPKPIDPEDNLLESVKDLRAVVSNLTMLSSRIQELEQSEFKALQMEISDLQLRLKTVTAESQEKMDAQAATIIKLNKALRTKLESEKELQDVVKQQEEKMLQLIDKSGEVTRLKGEVSQLKRSLQRAETEAKVLWEEMQGKEPKVDTVYIQERVLLRQEVDKLRLLLLEKEDENLLLSDKYLEKVQGLEMRLHHAQKALRANEEIREKMKEVLLAIPDVAVRCQEHHSLLQYLGLKPVSKEAAKPL